MVFSRSLSFSLSPSLSLSLSLSCDGEHMKQRFKVDVSSVGALFQTAFDFRCCETQIVDFRVTLNHWTHFFHRQIA